MREIRLAKEDEIEQQKEIWKLCFGDCDSYINFFYNHRNRADETLILLEEGEILSMLTMIRVDIVTASKRKYDATMLYAIATHPRHQGRGAAARLMEFTHRYLKDKNIAFSVLVPGEKQLFDFYRTKGYQEGFYVRESLYTLEEIANLSCSAVGCCKISSISPREYNRRRNEALAGRLYISYVEQEIFFQKKWSEFSGAGTYGIETGEAEGCATIERINADKVLIKELLIPEKSIVMAVRDIAELLPAKQYIVRTPAFCGGHLAGDIRPFGMFRETRETGLKITPGDHGYLGLAFD